MELSELQHPPDLLVELRAFIQRERAIATARRLEQWELPMQEKRDKALAQRFRGLEHGSDPCTAWATLAGGESRFREGDRLCLHTGTPFDDMLARDVVFEAEEETRWMLRFRNAGEVPPENDVRYFYAEQDAIDLSPMFEQTLDELAGPGGGGNVILPLLNGARIDTFDSGQAQHARSIALAEGLNALQADAVAHACSAHKVACIQGPPGTGKTRVLALVARLLVQRGETVMMTSHTHTAINHALEQIARTGIPTLKVGAATHARSLGEAVARTERLAQWKERPAFGGYVVGATPFATCGRRLEMCEFDTILFDEASQVTVPLALMAMRRGRRFVFIGDQQQLPPVVLSRSVLSGPPSVFSRFTANNRQGVMLRQTYRMNRELAAWPSRVFYAGALEAAGANADRKLLLGPAAAPSFAASVLRAAPSAIFIATSERKARSRNDADARLVAALCRAAREGGMALADIGIVTPFRAQARAIRKQLTSNFGWRAAREVLADTVERMQGQEREVVILSLAAGDLAFLAAVADFFFQRERLNVSVTRAMTKLIIIGPDIPAQMTASDPHVARNIQIYRDLVNSCARMVAPPPSPAARAQGASQASCQADPTPGS